MLGNGRLAVRVQIDFTEHRQNHAHLLSPQPSSNMTHRFEKHGNTGNLEKKNAKNIIILIYYSCVPLQLFRTYLKMGFIMKIGKRLREFNKEAGRPTTGADSGEECVLIN